MDATSFQFTMSLPGNTRLLGAVRDLTAHAAGYARLAPAAAQGLTDEVVAAAEAAMAATRAEDVPIEFLFVRQGATLRVTIAADAAASEAPPARPGAAGRTVNWSRQGSRQTCVIVQQIAS